MASAGKHGGPTTESLLLANQPKDTINLAVGHPMQSELPNKIISDAMKRCGSVKAQSVRVRSEFIRRRTNWSRGRVVFVLEKTI